MKSVLFTLVILLTVVAQKCMNEKEKTVPDCIRQKIDKIKSEPRWNPPAEVYEYEYEGRTVYYFSSPCCDQYNEVYDENCNYICAPSGGYTGKGDQKCGDFNEKAKKIKLVWKDDRE